MNDLWEILPTWDMLVEMAGYGVIFPAIIAIAAWISASWAENRLSLRGSKDSNIHTKKFTDLAGALIGLLAGDLALVFSGQFGTEFFKPADAWNWLPALTVLAFIAAVLARFTPIRFLGCILKVIAVGLSGWILFKAQNSVSPISPWWPLIFGAAGFAIWFTWDQTSETLALLGLSVPILTMITLFTTASLMEFSGNLRLAQIAGVPMGVAAAAAFWTWRRPATSWIQGLIPACAVLVPGLLFNAYHNTYSEIPAFGFALPVLALLALPLCAKLPVSKHHALVAWILTFILSSLTLGLAMVFA